MFGFLFWLTAIVGTALTLAYQRIDLRRSSMVLGGLLLAYIIFGAGGWFWKLLLIALFAGLALLNIDEFRRENVTSRLLRMYRKMLPSMSKTERQALEAGSVWWDGELFSGAPAWNKLLGVPVPRLSNEEQAFLDGPVNDFCRMIDDWQVTHELGDLPPEAWDFLKKKGFFAMIIKKKYGGLEFSALAHSAVLAKVASRSATASSVIAVPNSLGPAELLQHYGTEEQKDYYLPRLARGDEIPCFALTSPRAGSDATSLTDSGVVTRGVYDGKETIGIRLNFDKRYITLAPVATVIGLAFKLYDPDHLMGDKDEYGITCALVPREAPGVEIGRRHFPLNVPFQNGPIKGTDVFVPLDFIIGGPAMAGEGWKMLCEQLSVGRCISLPSNATGGAKAGIATTGAYARIRKQFNLPIGRFEGIEEVIARIAGRAYTMEASRTMTSGAVDLGESPSVVSAIVKYHMTEMGRMVANDVMDVHGGKAIMLGPKNYLARSYQAVPVTITVEGANILTRSMIIFGQGAIRCHPYVLREMESAKADDLDAFDKALFGHIGYAVSNASRAFVMAITMSRFSHVPLDGPTKHFYQHINRFSAAFALAADTAMLTLGGALKKKETLSGRLGDMLSLMYLASAVLKRFEDQGRPAADLPLVEYACRDLLYRLQEQMTGFLRNFPNRFVALAIRGLIFPFGRSYHAPSDRLGHKVAQLMIAPTETRARLIDGIYDTLEPSNPIGLLEDLLHNAIQMEPLEKRIRAAVKKGEIAERSVEERVNEAEEKNVLTAEEAQKLRAYQARVFDIISVDDFEQHELGTKAQPAATRERARAADAA